MAHPKMARTGCFRKTLGIIGCSKIGTSMARMAGMGFNAQVIGYDPYKSKDELAIKGIEKVHSLHTLLEESDFISLHAVLTNETHHILGKKELAKVKRLLLSLIQPEVP